jgi:hypothetical protein
MIIDKILDRKDGQEYSPKKFYNDIRPYGSIGYDILDALDSGTEQEVKKQLSLYIIENDYNNEIVNYINSVSWLDNK